MKVINLKQMQSNDCSNDWYKVVNSADGESLDLYLYGVIGWDVTLQQLLAELSDAGDVKQITVYLNTVGGSFYDGLPIYNTLKQHKAFVTVKVMGYALSMGSVIMLAGDVVQASESSLVMIHRAQGGVWGDAGDMERGAQVLKQHEATIIPEYSRRMKLSNEQVQELLDAETWYTAREAKDAGLVDVIIDDDMIDDQKAFTGNAANQTEYAVSNYKNTPPKLYAGALIENLTGDEDMKPEDIEKIVELVAAKMKQDATPSNQTHFVTAENQSLQNEVDQLKQALKTVTAERDALRTEVAELNEEVPGTVVPINTGPSGDDRYYDKSGKFF